MKNTIKIMFPSLAEEPEWLRDASRQTGWKICLEYQVPVGQDPWPWQHRLIWRVMMWAHNHVERLWHWLYYSARRFREPAVRTETRYHEIIDTGKP